MGERRLGNAREGKGRFRRGDELAEGWVGLGR